MSLTELQNPQSIPTTVTTTADSNAPASGAKQSVPDFADKIEQSGLQLKRAKVSELQINLGKVCNQACEHCHVEAGPKRTEIMQPDVVNRILDWIRNNNIVAVDLTGGAPELNSSFRYIVETLRSQDINVTSRCNLTVLYEDGQEDLAQWYAEQGVKLVCSLPCYSKTNVDAQRGKGVFDKSIRALQWLNSLGFGVRSDLTLDLVYNPGGPFLPPQQSTLETEYRQRLYDDFQIQFSNLYTLTNLPVHRFAHYLRRTNQYDDYMTLLENNFNTATIDGLMCRHIISVDWLGRIFDCDFNQMLEIPMAATNERYLWDLNPGSVEDGQIAVADHCYGCTAGAGSSCGGSLV